jgi:hypothetical protein
MAGVLTMMMPFIGSTLPPYRVSAGFIDERVTYMSG